MKRPIIQTQKTSAWLSLALAAILIGLVGVRMALAYAEEPIGFYDPVTLADFPEQEISTIHYDLTYAMALAAGFSVEDSVKLQLWDQLVDSEQLGQDAQYSNCGGSFPPPPDPAAVCDPDTDIDQVAWPLWDSMQDPDTCVTSRFGPYSPFFHFPRSQDIASLRAWAWDPAQPLVGYEAYAWGGVTVLQATCPYTETVTVDTIIPAGSLEAFATYLHSLGDAYSHRECMDALEAMGAPWGTHSLPPAGITECTYVPANPQNDDAHGREFGARWMGDSQRTDEALLAIYAELVARSLAREGEFYPISLDQEIEGLGFAQTLRQALYLFVHSWDFEASPPQEPGVYAQNRRDYARQIAEAVLGQRTVKMQIYLPMISFAFETDN